MSDDSSGALYGGLCEIVPDASIGLGIPFGVVLWVFGDELAVPLLRFGSSPFKTPLPTQIDALAAHVVYGITADGVRRNLRAGMRSHCEE
ncbi:MAG TPA: hypothetical protein VHE81_14170 [Lacipirellulaceae bacterium]|nr:hypothetical protein [Lacipirellulaceae bacterium]